MNPTIYPDFPSTP